ncbi:aminoacyl-tRNA hydrolase [Spirochaeta cellobiosiphila]|uniref:aminoacyl-tRNA hydrolase n=1 Tax=Spirochaeta cellobiosiphila TaxID=504483 RepID=UPI00056A2460|nr:aminoacyl-tRNA hydrolase [Spirochaeta cellobiosiphila]
MNNKFLFVGLGNPGSQYDQTRHNVGFMMLDRISSKYGLLFKKPMFRSYLISHLYLNNSEYILVKPLTYMNKSGEVLPYLLNRYDISLKNTFVFIDNMDLPVGRCKLKRSGGNAGHNGLKSILASVEDEHFNRIYIGVGRPTQGVSVVDHVLGQFDDSSLSIIEKTFEALENPILSLGEQNITQVLEGINRINVK